MKSCLERISSLYDKLSYSERLFADESLAHPDSVVYKSIAEMSESIGIATSTIVATTKKLGFSGFREFKIALASEMINPVSTEQRNPEDLRTGGQSVYDHIVRSEITALEEALKTLPQKTFDQASSILASAKRVHIIGIGTSAILARELHDYLFRLGLDCNVFEDLHHQLLVSRRADENDAAILISQSGVNREIINIGIELKRHNAKVIGISNFQNTPFGKTVDILLAPFKTLTSFHENNFTLRIPMIAMMETLYYTLSELIYERYSSSMEDYKDVIKNTAITAKE